MTDWNHTTVVLPEADYGNAYLPVRVQSSVAPADPTQDTFCQLPVNALAAVDLSNVTWTALAGATITAIGQTLKSGNALPAITGTYFNFSSPTFTLTSMGAIVPANGAYVGHGGNSLSFQTLISNPSGGADSDNQRATMLIRSITTDDGNSEEQTLCLLTTIQTGYSAAYANSTAYSVGANFTANGEVYRVTTGGISAATGSGPSTKADGITDGTLVCNWINDSSIDAKVGFYNEVEVKPGAGQSWAQAHNIQIDAGVQASFVINTELDFTNNCGTDSVFGGLNKYNLLITTDGGNVSTACAEINSPNTTNFAAIWGLHLDGSKLASHSVIGIDASSANGLSFGVNGGGVSNPTFTNSVINDSSNAPVGIALAGAYSAEAINISGTAPAAISISGTKSFASIFDTSVTPSAIKLQGTYSSSAIAVNATSDPAALSLAGTNSLASIFDASTSPTGLALTGSYAAEAINVTGTTPAALAISGAKSLSSIYDTATAPHALYLNGTYSGGAIAFGTLPGNYANDAAAATAGIPVGGIYRNGSVMMVRAA